MVPGAGGGITVSLSICLRAGTERGRLLGRKPE